MRGIFKRSAIGLAVLSLTSSVYAGTVTGAFIGIDGLDLQPRNGDLDFISVLPSGFGTFSTHSIHPSYSWDFRLYGGLTFCGDEDLTVSWMRFYTHDHNDFGTAFEDVGVPADSIMRFFTLDSWSDVVATVNFKLDDVYAVFGHTERLGPWSIRWAYGVEWFRLDSDFTTSGIIPGSALQPVNEELSYESQSLTRGVGPRVEFDFAYQMPYGFYAFARPNAALLISSRDIELVPNDTDILDTFAFTKRRVIIPRLGIRLGLGFTWGYGAVGGEGVATPFDATLVTVEAGWQAESYIHAIERPEGFENPGINSGARSNLTTKVSNFGDQGFFIGIKLSTSWL